VLWTTGKQIRESLRASEERHDMKTASPGHSYSLEHRLITIWALPFITVPILTVGWWRLWMYCGWFGAPHIVRRFFARDGERVYDSEMLDMAVVLLCFAVVFAVLLTRYCCRKGVWGRINE